MSEYQPFKIHSSTTEYFRPGCIAPLIRFSVWAYTKTIEEYGEEYKECQWYITDDFGNAVKCEPMKLWNWDRSLSPIGQYLFH